MECDDEDSIMRLESLGQTSVFEEEVLVAPLLEAVVVRWVVLVTSCLQRPVEVRAVLNKQASLS